MSLRREWMRIGWLSGRLIKIDGGSYVLKAENGKEMILHVNHVTRKDDVAPGELASYVLHTLAAASDLPSKAAVRRLVAVTLSGLRPPR